MAGGIGLTEADPVILKAAGNFLMVGIAFLLSVHVLRLKLRFELASLPALGIAAGSVILLGYQGRLEGYNDEVLGHLLPRLLQEGPKIILALVLLAAGISAALLLARRLSQPTYRSLFHVVAGSFFLLVLLQSIHVNFIALALALDLLLVAEYLRRLNDPRSPVVRFVHRIFTPALRAGEVGGYMASLFFLSAMFLVTLLLPLPLAAGAVAVLTYGDPAASFFGRRWGRHKWRHNPQKSIEGTLAMFGVCAGLLLILAPAAGLHPATALLAALAAALFESLPLRIGDNLILPLLAGMVLTTNIGAQVVVADRTLWLVAVPFLLGLGLFAYATRMLDFLGSGAAVFFGLLVFQASVPSLIALLAFLFLGFGVTRLRYDWKAALQAAEPDGGRRSVNPVVANGVVPAFLAVLPASTGNPYLLAGALSGALADTLATELGLLHPRPVLMSTGKPVAPGTRGAISLYGEGAVVAGGALMGILWMALAGLFPGTGNPAGLMMVCMAGAVAGAHTDSFLGAAVRALSKEEVNLLGTLTGGAVALMLWMNYQW
ncbi:MAG: DUF92 domain-containing protein [Halobacteria archaeon]